MVGSWNWPACSAWDIMVWWMALKGDANGPKVWQAEMAGPGDGRFGN